MARSNLATDFILDYQLPIHAILRFVPLLLHLIYHDFEILVRKNGAWNKTEPLLKQLLEENHYVYTCRFLFYHG